MKFCWCTISVGDMEESIKFYQEIIGLSMNKRFQAGPKTEICFLGDGDIQVELVKNEEQGISGSIEGISLGFEVRSVDEMIQFIKDRGMEIESGPFQPNPKVKFFFVKDPNGVSIQFVENM